MAQSVKNLTAMRETWVLSLGWGDLLEEDMATHSSILAWSECVYMWRSCQDIIFLSGTHLYRGLELDMFSFP